ncbi:MAG: AAA family ATPase [Gammaproteobacteria bacterium]
MQLHLERTHALSLMERFPALESLGEQLRFGNRVDIGFTQLDPDQLAFLAELYRQAGPDHQARAAQVLTLHQALDEPRKRFQDHELEQVLPELIDYLVEGGIRGWLFKATPSAKPMPYVVTRLDFTPPSEEEAGRLLIELKANTCGKIASETVVIRGRDIAGLSVGGILAGKGYLKETTDLVEAYDRSEARYFEWRAASGMQFSARGTGYYAEDPSASHRNRDWTRKNIIVLSSSGADARLVNDESILEGRALNFEGSGEILTAYLRRAAKSSRYDEDVESAMEAARDGLPEGLFTRLPVHGYLFMFHLELHHHLWVHVDDLRAYEYRPELKDKLILPREQTDLIDILTAEMDLLMDDIVAGKSGGTTVLCAGPAGVGKTLTAEVYAEIIRRPLYRVHSGQLGLNVSEMEQALKDTLTRAQRWGAVMLIDEADVYIKRRDDDIAANAVVGVFLRVLEYFNGLLFLTTNRVDDIDEAIVSRCIAMIRYETPDAAARRRIWSVMANQFALPLDAALIDTLVERFPSASGRDIKGLTKLVVKFCNQKDIAPDEAVFERCAVFRGLEMTHKPEPRTGSAS